MNEDRNYSVYMHLFPDDKVYIGLTKQDPKKRWDNGFGYREQPVFKAIQEFGWNNIEHYIISGLTQEEAQSKEKELIQIYDSINNGYNVSTGGGCGGNPWVEIEYQGKFYTPSELLKFSKVKGLTEHDLTNRIRFRNKSVEEALSTPKTSREHLHEYNGGMYTFEELLKFSKTELTVQQLKSRIYRGWSVERALTQPNNVKKQPSGVGEKIYEYNGKMYNSYELWEIRKCKELKVFDITNRINHHGWDVEAAISKPKKAHNTLYTYKGHQYTTTELAELSPYKNVTKHTINDRLKSGWSIDKAVNTPITDK